MRLLTVIFNCLAQTILVMANPAPWQWLLIINANMPWRSGSKTGAGTERTDRHPEIRSQEFREDLVSTEAAVY